MPGAAIFPGSESISTSFQHPILCVVVDAEEEFCWSTLPDPGGNSLTSIRAQSRAHAIFAHYKVRPTYMATWPVVMDPAMSGVLREWQTDGTCDIGAHLHPWVTPPFGEDRGVAQSFPGNLPQAAERSKLLSLVEAIETTMGNRPTIYRAGRYGLGPNTAGLLEEAGFVVDTSLIPRTSYAAIGGPDYMAWDYAPFWFGSTHHRLLELPVTRALIGGLASAGSGLYRQAEGRSGRAVHLGGVLARSRLLERITLSPEGSDLASMCRLTRALLARGQQIFTLSYHSPSLVPGNTPYVRSDRDLAEFLDRISGFLNFFQRDLDGECLTITALHDRLSQPQTPATPTDELPRRGMRAAPATRDRCLVVANTFPPVHGGSAVVYDSLGRFSGGRVSVLAPSEDYRSGLPITGWREFDQAAPYPVHRLRLLRTHLSRGNQLWRRLLVNPAQDLAIRFGVVRQIGRLIRSDQIGALCIGELVASGWLTWVAQRLFKLTCVVYVHGEEATTETPYDMNGRRRRRALGLADGIVAVSRFTRDTLVERFGVPPDKIALISNGVDPEKFSVRPRRPDLVARHGLGGKQILLTVGRLYARKGMDRVIESLLLLQQAFPDLVYLVVGEGPYREDLVNLASSLGVADRLILAGEVSDNELADYYALGDLFIMANRTLPDGDTEGFGLVFLEANACGVPVIAGRDGGSPDAVSDGVNGLVIDGNDPAAIAGAVQRILSDSALREALRDRGLETARDVRWDRKVAQFLTYCDTLRTARR
jgi:phosphatidylinositol alpha-1,6-mannosyltransferase